MPSTPAQPRVSVVMSVYNGQEYVAEAIESILNQTFKDFEFIIINDGSTDDTLTLISGYHDTRIKLISRRNKGLVASLNEGIEVATGRYIARQDADDISLPGRLRDQVKAFEDHPQLVLCGTGFQDIDFHGVKGSITELSLSPSLLKLEVYTRSPFCHGSIMAKKESIQKVGGYSDRVGPVEDYDLWIRLKDEGDFMNLKSIRYLYRIQPNSISHQQAKTQHTNTKKLQDKLWTAQPPKASDFILAYVRNRSSQVPYLPLFFSRFLEFTQRYHRLDLAVLTKALYFLSKLTKRLSV